MKINLTGNKREGQSTLHAVFDFFFPYTKRLRIEAKSTAYFNIFGVYRVEREFFTFRACVWHYLLLPGYVIRTILYLYKCALDDVFRLDPTGERGAIAFDVASNSGAFTNATSVIWSHTNTGSNLVLGVGVPWYEFETSNNNVTVTYNAVAMTSVVGVGYSATPTYRSELFRLASPATGANNVALTFVGGAYGAAGACSFSGADTANPIDVFGTNTASASASISKSVTTNYANSMLMDCLKGNDSNAGGAVDAGQTSRWNVLGSNTNTNAGSTKSTTTAGLYSMGWSGFSSAQNFAYAVMAIREAATDFSISVSDTVSVAEAITMLLTSNISVSDSVTITESIVMEMTSAINVSDTVQVTDSLEKVDLTSFISIFDAVTLTESVSVTVPDLGNISVSDSVTITESITMDRPLIDTIVFMRRGTQTYPLGLDESDPKDMRGGSQSYPRGLDDSRIL